MRVIVLSAISIILTTWASARTWTYSECVEYARVHNITLQKALLAEQTSEYNLEEAQAQWQPTLDFATTQGYTNSPWGQIKNSYNSSYGLNAGWTVWNGGKRENTIKQQKLQTSIDKLNTNDIMRTLETDLLQVYINILYAKESIGIYEDAVELSKAQEQRGLQFMNSGKMSKVDYQRLKSQYEQDKYALVNAQATYDQRRLELKKLLELGLEEEIDLENVEWTAAQVLAALPSITESYESAQQTDLQIQQLDLQKQSSDLDVAIAKAGHMPNISLNAGVGTGYQAPGASFGTAMKQGFNENIGLSLSVPIFDQKKTKTAVARAKVAQEEADLSIEQRRLELAQLVENWYIETQNAQARYKAAESQLESAKLTDELTNEQFSIGYVNTIELMSAHNSYIEAQHNILQYKYMAMLGQKMIEYYRTATVTL